MAALQEYRQTEFAEATARGIYLNHAGVGPAPSRVVRAVHEAAAFSGSDPFGFFMEGVLSVMESARDRLARLMGVPVEHLALTKNTGHGLSIVADALRLSPGDNVVSADCEYPSVVYPWYARQDQGIETRLFPARPDGTLSLEDAAARMDAHTRVLTLSWVQFGTGFRADLKAWADLAHAHGAIFVVDVIQGLGALPVSAQEMGLDVVATGVHKWLLAPGGTGGLYVAPHVLDQMRLVNMGAVSVVDVVKFDPLNFTPKPTARRYEEGTPNGLGLYGLDAALSLLEEVGIERIAARVQELTRRAMVGLEAKGYHVASPPNDSERAGIVMFGHPEHDNDAIMAALTAANVAAAVRGGKVRFSPHFYNTDEEIDLAIDALT